MWELAKQTSGRPDDASRVMLGLGAWWEPIAGRVGETRERPLQAMREHVESIRQLFSMEEVTYQGEFVKLDRVKLDVVFGGDRPDDAALEHGGQILPCERCSRSMLSNSERKLPAPKPRSPLRWISS